MGHHDMNMEASLADSAHTRFRARLAEVGEAVDLQLDRLLPQIGGHHAVIHEAMRYAALAGGKRLRPFLVVETARMLGAQTGGAMLAACALEAVHAYSLVHDDLPAMDDDDIRRGKPTVHVVWDDAVGVLTGDALLTVAFEWMSREDVHADPAVRLALVAGLAKAAGADGMIGGQVIDMRVSETDRDEALITQLQAMKTGALIAFAGQAGAMLAGADSRARAALADFTRDLGLAFQIKDDILDAEGDAAVMGKAARKDQDLGKATFVSILGLEGARRRARDLGASAKAALDPFGDGAADLRACVDFVLHRNR